MLIYTIEHDCGLKHSVCKTLHIEGTADNGQKERLKAIMLDALSSSDHLIVNIEKVEGFDNSFSSLIWTIRRMAKLLGIRLTIKGKTEGFIHYARDHHLH